MKDDVGYPIGVVVHEEDYKLLKTLLIVRFDADCDDYEAQYHNLVAQVKYIKKYLLIKTLLFPLELTLAFLLLGKSEVRARKIHQRKIWKGLRSKHLSAEQITELYELC